MKNKLLFLSVFLCQISVFSQQGKMDDDIKKYTARIDSIVTSEKLKMNDEMNLVEKNFQSGNLSSEELKARKMTIAEKYEKIINDKVDAENAELQKITKETAVNSVFKKNSDTVKTTVVISNKQGGMVQVSTKKEKTPKDYLKNDYLAVSYGFMNLTKDAGSLSPFENDSKMRIGNSHSFEIQARKERQLGSFESPFFIHYGLAYRSDTYMPKRPLVVAQNNEQIYFEDFTQGSLKRSKLRNVYLTLPVDFQWVLNPKYTDYEDQKYLDGKSRQFRIGAGVYAGVNIRNIVKVKYYDQDNKFSKYDYTLDHGVNTFLFGAKLSVSYGGINLFIKKDLTPIFNDHALFPNKNGIQIGIDLMNLDF
ncbi:MAG TPA: hypothetical protein PKV58_08575 [Kaistella sp.]|nr:hypothetical protein [Kaistella sp.]